VTIVDFIQENMRVLSTVCDRSIGGRDFDDVIVEFLAESFQKKTGKTRHFISPTFFLFSFLVPLPLSLCSSL
jgi:molecular chaperone DnaK (HSP70)